MNAKISLKGQSTSRSRGADCDRLPSLVDDAPGTEPLWPVPTSGADRPEPHRGFPCRGLGRRRLSLPLVPPPGLARAAGVRVLPALSPPTSPDPRQTAAAREAGGKEENR